MDPFYHLRKHASVDLQRQRQRNEEELFKEWLRAGRRPPIALGNLSKNFQVSRQTDKDKDKADETAEKKDSKGGAEQKEESENESGKDSEEDSSAESDTGSSETDVLEVDVAPELDQESQIELDSAFESSEDEDQQYISDSEYRIRLSPRRNSDSSGSYTHSEAFSLPSLPVLNSNNPPTPPNRFKLKALGTLVKEFYSHLTISDDQSTGRNIQERKLHALKSGAERQALIVRFPVSGTPGVDYRALTDYQMQLMLLEQQTKKRLLLARQEQENMSGKLPSHALRADVAADIGPSRSVKPILGEISNQFDTTDMSKLDLEKLQEYIDALQSKARLLEELQLAQAPNRAQFLYRIVHGRVPKTRAGGITRRNNGISGPYLDRPQWVKGVGSERHPECKILLDNLALYLEKNKDIAFVVYRDFHFDEDGRLLDPFGKNTDRDSAYLEHTHEHILPVSQELIEAVETILDSRTELNSMLSEFKENRELKAPYLFIYHNRETFSEMEEEVPPAAQKQLSALRDWVLEEYGDEYAMADSILSRGHITSEFVKYLFKPGDILVSRKNDEFMGHMATCWPDDAPFRRRGRKFAHNIEGHSDKTRQPSSKVKHDRVDVNVWAISCWHWSFDGSFQRQNQTVTLEIALDSSQSLLQRSNSIQQGTHLNGEKGLSKQAKGKEISELNLFPLKYAPEDLVNKLQKRGERYWKCRNRCFISYQESEENMQHLAEERYMVDLSTYRSLHEVPYNATNLDELGEEALASDEPPDGDFALLVPYKIKGYNLRRKKWFDLIVDRISDIIWNKEAFQSLVIESKARDLIRALVSKQIAAEKSTDLITGKGNGLILLLHGGPGTGKTLTAESVAEIAEKPLYRVTCGDVGTKAEDVEKYLESVLHLGKIWGCVVLLDEADVFLEQRSLEDLQRNALVSVFLRILEYYEGILILTSNRVGTFDEAFKSRIQLALHYPRLGLIQRLRIWENFIKRLESFSDVDIDIADLTYNVEDLAKVEMNGREIRNAITTARQYAEWKGVTLTYKQLEDVIEISGRFDKYLGELNQGFTQDQLAQDEGRRLDK